MGGWFLFFFFFQAEDGIRDGRVTGVQTCALPISSGLVSTIGRTLGCILPAGHSPAMAVEVVATEPAIIPASARPCQIVREAALDLDMSWSPLFFVFASRFALAPNDLAGYVT